MKIKTKNGFAIIDPKVVLFSEYFVNEYNGKQEHELRILLEDNPMMIMLVLANRELVLQTIEEIEHGKIELKEKNDVGEIGHIEAPSFIDGFKAGVEYTLKLKD